MKKIFGFLFLVLLIKGILAAAFIVSGVIGLAPDEAQYWTWAKNLDWGYYSKPPGIAWQIWIGSQLVGNTELGVRFVSLWVAAGLSLGVFALATSCGCKPVTCFWAGICMAVSPLGMIASLLATTDGGFILFWTLALIPLLRAVRYEQAPNYLLMGLLIGLGALFKWPTYWLWLFVLAIAWWLPFLRTARLAVGILLSFLALIPSLIWNWNHDWATFRHVAATMIGGPQLGGTSGVGRGTQGNFWEFIGAQAGLLSPIFFGMLVIALFSILILRKPKKIPLPLIVCAAMTAAILGMNGVLALFQRMQGNWAAYAYPSAIVVLCWYACEQMKSGVRWLSWGSGLALVMVVIPALLPVMQSHDVTMLGWQPPYKLNLFRHNLGWSKLTEALEDEDVGYQPNTHFLFGDSYQMTSLLSFYGPQQKRAYFLDLQDKRKNQFSYWPSMAQEQTGRTGFFVYVENAPEFQATKEKMIRFYQEQLGKYHQKVELIAERTLFTSYERLAKGCLIFRCSEYSGELPEDSEVY